MEGEEPDMGPSLVNMAEQYKGKLPAGYSLEDYIRTSILKPNEHIAMGFESDIMPDDLSERMRVSELEMAVQTIIGAGKGN
jgi:cytochrome c551/c552